MRWKNIKPSHYFKDPVIHIYSQTVFDVKEYDRLYENQNNLDHQSHLLLGRELLQTQTAKALDAVKGAF